MNIRTDSRPSADAFVLNIFQMELLCESREKKYTRKIKRHPEENFYHENYARQ